MRRRRNVMVTAKLLRITRWLLEEHARTTASTPKPDLKPEALQRSCKAQEPMLVGKATPCQLQSYKGSCLYRAPSGFLGCHAILGKYFFFCVSSHDHPECRLTDSETVKSYLISFKDYEAGARRLGLALCAAHASRLIGPGI